jgi:hypothetical protein
MDANVLLKKCTKQWTRDERRLKSARGAVDRPNFLPQDPIHNNDQTSLSPPTLKIMAPKGKGGDKSKTADKGAEKKGAAQKGAQSINVRHILCEKHAKKEEALKKLNDGAAFNKVAEEYSEDKARAGELYCGFLDINRDDFVDSLF